MRRMFLIAVRLLLAGIFLWAAIAKLREPWLLFAANLDSMQLLPTPAVFFIARVLPWAELLLGALLLTGLQARYTVPVATVMLLIFFGVLVDAYWRGLTVDCGCFGPGEALGPLTLVRDGLLLAISGWAAYETWRPSQPARQQ